MTFPSVPQVYTSCLRLPTTFILNFYIYFCDYFYFCSFSTSCSLNENFLKIFYDFLKKSQIVLANNILFLLFCIGFVFIFNKNFESKRRTTITLQMQLQIQLQIQIEVKIIKPIQMQTIS